MCTHHWGVFACLGGVAVLIGTGAYVYHRHGHQARQANLDSCAVGQQSACELASPSTMEEWQRQYLWQIEHHGNILARGEYGFRALGKALSRTDRSKLLALLATGFTARTLGYDREEV